MPNGGGVERLARRVTEGVRRIGRWGALAGAFPDGAGSRPVVARPFADLDRAVASALAPLLAEGWVCLERAHWPGRGDATLDRIVIGPGGVFVVATRQRATPRPRPKAGSRQGGASDVGLEPDTDLPAPEPGDLLRAGAAAVAALLEPRHRTAVRPVECRSGAGRPPVSAPAAPRPPAPRGRRRPQDVPGPADAGTVESGAADAALTPQALVALLRGAPQRFSPADVAAVHARLSGELYGPQGPEQLTTSALEEEPHDALWAFEVLTGELAPLNLDTWASGREQQPPRRARRSLAPGWVAPLLRLMFAVVTVTTALLLVPALLQDSSPPANAPSLPAGVPGSTPVGDVLPLMVPDPAGTAATGAGDTPAGAATDLTGGLPAGASTPGPSAGGATGGPAAAATAAAATPGATTAADPPMEARPAVGQVPPSPSATAPARPTPRPSPSAVARA